MPAIRFQTTEFGYIYSILDVNDNPVYIGRSEAPHKDIRRMIVDKSSGREVTDWLRSHGTNIYIPENEVYSAWYNKEPIKWPSLPVGVAMIKWHILDEAPYDSPFPLGTLSNYRNEAFEKGYTLFNKKRGRKKGHTPFFLEVRRAASNEEKIALYKREIKRLEEETKAKKTY